MKAGNRIVLNTGVMYGRMLVTMVVTLLSSRWVLQALGKEDFGIYNLVAGLLSMLMFLNLTMATASQRFLSYALGQGDEQQIKDTFYYSCVLHFIIGCIIVLGVEVVGQIMLHTVLIVPEGKLYLAVFCLHCLSVSTFFTVISVPYNAALIAHENIVFVAVIRISEAFLKLFVAVFLLHYLGNRLQLYAICMATIPLLSVIIYRFYCHRNYTETRLDRIRRITNSALFKKFTAYAGWNMIGSISSLLRTQGVSILLNSFYGVIINAAYGIATQVKGQMSHFSSAIVTAARPQIVKSEGAGNRARTLSLSASTCKFTFLLLSMLAVPLIIEMPYVLTLWLKNVPEYTINFTRLIIIQNVIFQIAIGVSIPIESVGNIKMLQIMVGGLHFIVLPIGYVMLRLGMSPDSIFVMIILEECIAIALRLFISHRVTGLDIMDFLKKTIIPSVLTVSGLALLCYGVSLPLHEGWGRLLLLSTLSIGYMVTVAYRFTLTNSEKVKVQGFFNTFSNKIRYGNKGLLDK